MHIEEVKQLKSELQTKILELLSQFEKTTGVSVADVRVDHLYPVGGSRRISKIKLLVDIPE